MYACFATPDTAIVSLNPASSQVLCGDNVLINVTISNVVDLYGWQFKVFYEASSLNATEVTEGPFLKSHAGANGTYFVLYKMNDNYNSTHGIVFAYCLLLGKPATGNGATGSGVLATIKFNCTNYGKPHLALEYPGFAYPAKLSDINSKPIPCTTTTGADVLIMVPHTVTATTTTTVTISTTVTTTATTTTETTVPTMDITSVAGAGIVALVVGVAVGWLFASRKKKE